MRHQTTQATNLAHRQKDHRRLAGQLKALDDGGLMALLSAGQITKKGCALLSLPGCTEKSFVKLVPVTARELKDVNRAATHNIFSLPTYYQYRLGSFGFGAWRELRAHQLAHTWVDSAQCPHFPLLHHWRILPITQDSYDDRMDLSNWGPSPAICARVSEIKQATHSLVLFLEYFPQTLSQWLEDTLRQVDSQIKVIETIEQKLRELLSFTQSREFLHLDAHFDNFLTDGHQLYLSDFGLALCRDFTLQEQEIEFFEQHQNFDLCTALTSLAHAVVSQYYQGENWRQALLALGALEQAIPDKLKTYFSRRTPIVLMVGDFYRRLGKDLSAAYPATHLQGLLEEALPPNNVD